MEKIVEQTLLYDFYGELLTEHQRRIYEDVVFNDYSLSEVAQELGISRQGVHDNLKDAAGSLRTMKKSFIWWKSLFPSGRRSGVSIS